MKALRHGCAVFATAALMLGCSEEPQTAGGAAGQGEAASWKGAQNPYVAPGWTTGDQASWEQQMRSRMQGQNEYSRTTQ
jgi:hypothetical protein